MSGDTSLRARALFSPHQNPAFPFKLIPRNAVLCPGFGIRLCTHEDRGIERKQQIENQASSSHEAAIPSTPVSLEWK